MNTTISTTTASTSSSDPPDFTPPNSDDQGMISRQFFRTSFHYSEDQDKHSQMLLNPRKKRSKLIRIDDSTASTSSNIVGKRKYCKKPDPSAPKITRPCTECGKRFWSVKALFGHMRCHPERQWRGINPPPNLRRSSTSDHYRNIADVQYDVLPRASSMMTEEDQQVASCLLMLANAPPPAPPCTAVSEQTMNPASATTITVRNQGVLDSDIRDYPDVFGCEDIDHPYVDHGAGPSGVSNFKFECSSCKKVFGSHQALGGHRASHKNVKGCFAINKNDCATEDDYNSTGYHDHRNVDHGDHDKLLIGSGHKCSICLRVFPSGQALGGHKRCHWEKGDELSSLTHGPNQLVAEEGGGLDLNFPAAVEDDHLSSSLTSGLCLDLRLGL